MDKDIINFDHAATLVLPVEMYQQLLDVQREFRYNPSSSYRLAKKGMEAIESCKAFFLQELGLAESHDLYFVPSATVANNIAINMAKENWDSIAVYGCDHPSIVEPARHFFTDHKLSSLQEEPSAEENSFFATSLVQSLTGIKISIAKFLSRPPNSVHLDISQGFAKFPLSLTNISESLASFTLSAHKMGGPLGIAALGIKKGILPPALIYGGQQESQIWSGTLNPGAIAGWRFIYNRIKERREDFQKSMSPVVEKMLSEICCQFEGQLLSLFFDSELSPYIRLLGLVGTPSDMAMRFLEQEGLLVATSTACSSRSKVVLKEFPYLGLDKKLAKGLLRLSFSPWQTDQEILQGQEILLSTLKRIIK